MARTKNWIGTIFGNIGIVSWVIVRWLNCFPGSTPGSIENVIRGSRDKLFVGRSYKVLYQTGISIRKHGISTENAFEYEDDFHGLVKLIEEAFQSLDKLRQSEKIYQSSHIPVRFVQKSDAYLSPCYTGPKVFVDFPTLEDVKGSRRILLHNQEFCLARDGVPHWGKMNECMCELVAKNPNFIQEHYPKVEVWKATRKQFDKDDIFLSDFVIEMGLK